jgi:hypothetical protein
VTGFLIWEENGNHQAKGDRLGLWIKRVSGLIIVGAITAAIGITIGQGFYHGRYGGVIYRTYSPVSYWFEVGFWSVVDLLILKWVIDLFKRGKNV